MSEVGASTLPPHLLRELTNATSDQYAIEQEIGSGGMALVFRVRDLKHERPVALKVLRPELASRVGRERFLREIRLAARLTHPHILPLHDSGAAGGLLYYVMPLVDGESLRQRIDRKGPLSPDEVAGVVRAVAGALDYAHRQGVVHRDIKPENIMMHDGVPMVTDFGIGKAVSEVGSEQLTQTGTTMGTPAYMSPEQMYGEIEVDGRSDLYSLALIAYEMINGERLFAGPSPQAILARRAANPRPVLSFPSDTPAELQLAIRSALGEAPDDRPSTGAHVAELLANVRRSSGTGTASPGPLAVPAQAQSQSIAVLPFANMSGDPENEYFSDGVTEEIINALTRLEGLHVAARTSSFAFKGQSADVKDVGRRLNVGSVLEGSVRQAGNRLRVTAQLINVGDGYHLWSERYDREIDDVFAVQDEIATAIAERLSVELGTGPVVAQPKLPTADIEAYRLYLKGRHEWNHRTEDGLARAVELFRQAIERDPDYAPAYSGLADAYLLQGSYRIIPREESHERAKEAAERALALDPELAEAHTSLGQACRHERRWDDEERAYQRAIALNPGYATAHQWYSTLLSARGRHADALREIRRAEELDPLSHAIGVTVASVLFMAGETDAADKQLEKTLELEPDFMSAIAWTSGVYAMQGRFDEALKANHRLGETWGHDDPNVMIQRALVYAMQGAVDQAATLVDEAAGEADAGFVAQARTVLGQHEEALDLLVRAIEERSFWAFYLKVHPVYEPLRSDPRYAALLQTMGL